jgi:hypothetical protein
VDPKFVRPGWAIAAPLLKPAMRRGGLGRFADLERGVLFGNSLLWLALEDGTAIAAAVTDLVCTDVDKVCLIAAAGGVRMRGWLHLLERVEAFARDEHCTVVRLMGRKGWARMLPHYQQDHIILDRRL